MPTSYKQPLSNWKVSVRHLLHGVLSPAQVVLAAILHRGPESWCSHILMLVPIGPVLRCTRQRWRTSRNSNHTGVSVHACRGSVQPVMDASHQGRVATCTGPDAAKTLPCLRADAGTFAGCHLLLPLMLLLKTTCYCCSTVAALTMAFAGLCPLTCVSYPVSFPLQAEGFKPGKAPGKRISRPESHSILMRCNAIAGSCQPQSFSKEQMKGAGATTQQVVAAGGNSGGLAPASHLSPYVCESPRRRQLLIAVCRQRAVSLPSQLLQSIATCLPVFAHHI